MATNKNVIRYISDTQAQVTKAFEKKACVFGTDEFNEWMAYKKLFPNAKMVTKSIKKNEHQKHRRNKKFENMEEFIKTLPEKERDDAMAEYEYIKQRSKIQTCPYQYVLDWFEKRFKGYDTLDAFMNQKEAERKAKEEEAAAEKAATAEENED